MKNLLFRLCLLCLAVSVFSAEMVSDTKMRVDYTPCTPDAAWQHWQYDAEKHDYSGDFAPRDFQLIPGTGYRKVIDGEMASVPKNVLVTVVFVGQETGGRYKPSEPPRAIRSQMNFPLVSNFLSEISAVEGAYYEDGKIFLVGKKRQKAGNPVFLPEDIVVAFRAVANDPLRGASVAILSGISSGGMGQYAAVEYKGLTEQSHLGQVLFESDRLLKSLALGCDNITRKAIPLERWWHQTQFDFMDPTRKAQAEEWHRFWFLSEGMAIDVDKERRILKFNGDGMDVAVQKTKKGEEFYLDRSDSKSPGKYTENFRKNFSFYKNEFPVLNEFSEISKLFAISRWLYENGILMKFEKDDVKGLYSWYTPEKTPVIHVTKTRVVKKVDLRLYEVKEFEVNSVGGVDFTRFQFHHKNMEEQKSRWNTDNQIRILRLF